MIFLHKIKNNSKNKNKNNYIINNSFNNNNFMNKFVPINKTSKKISLKSIIPNNKKK